MKRHIKLVLVAAYGKWGELSDLAGSRNSMKFLPLVLNTACERRARPNPNLTFTGS